MSEYYLTGKVEKCESCNGRGYTESEGHPDCPMCNGCGYIEVGEQ